MGTNEPGYYAIIPSSVRYDKKLPANAKLLFGEITALCNKEGYCWATNEYFAELYGASDKTIGRWLKALKTKGVIFCSTKTFRYEDGTIKKVRYIGLDKNVLSELDKIELDHTDKNVLNHTDKNVPYNNTNSNNTDMNIESKDSKALGPVEEPVRTQRSLDIDQAFLIWEEVMGYPLQAAKKERMSINSILTRKGMDLDKLRLMVRLVAESQSDRYKRFSISSYTDMLHKTNELMAWAREKQAQNQSSSNVARV
jgi:hypothetical protein